MLNRGVDYSSQVSLAPYTSWLVGGPADFFCRPKTLDEVIQAQAWAQEQGLPLVILGGGSNVLISDQGVKGLVLCLRDFSGAVTRSGDDGYFRIEAWAGTGKSELLKIFLQKKLAPALFLAGLPGDLGGGLVMNAGVSEAITPREFTEITEWIEVLRPNGRVDRLSHSELKWEYRHMSGWEPGILVRAGLKWADDPDPGILDKVRQANKIRLSKQPLDLPSCGSVFVNPAGHKAAQLIDSCGLKGYTIGQAQVSLKHANFIVNMGGATASQIWALIRHVRQTVLEKTGVELKTEVVRIGEFPEV